MPNYVNVRSVMEDDRGGENSIGDQKEVMRLTQFQNKWTDRNLHVLSLKK